MPLFPKRGLMLRFGVLSSSLRGHQDTSENAEGSFVYRDECGSLRPQVFLHEFDNVDVTNTVLLVNSCFPSESLEVIF